MISPATFLAVAVFALATLATPGPNNMMVTASGVNFGFRRTVPHICGICIGFPAMMLAIGLGLGNFFAAYPQSHSIIKYAGAAYLCFLAYKIAVADGGGGAENKKTGGRPFTFLQAAAFQWVNPKAWAMSAGAMSTYTTLEGDIALQVVVISIIFLALAFPCVSIWGLAGAAAGKFLRRGKWLRRFNWMMAILLFASVIPFIA